MTVDDGISSMQCGFVSEIVSSARRGSDLRVVIASSYCFRRLLPIGKYFVYMHQLLLGSNLAAVATPLVMLLCSMNCRNSNCLAAIRFCMDGNCLCCSWSMCDPLALGGVGVALQIGVALRGSPAGCNVGRGRCTVAESSPGAGCSLDDLAEV